MRTLEKRCTGKQYMIEKQRKQIYGLKKTNERLRDISKQIIRPRRPFSELSTRQQFRVRNSCINIINMMHGNAEKEIGKTLSHLTTKDKSNKIAEVMSDNKKVKSIHCVWINKYKRTLLLDEDTIVHQTVTKIVSTISDNNWDKIRWGIGYHRKVIIKNGQAQLTEPYENVDDFGVKANNMCSARQTGVRGRELFFKQYPVLKGEYITLEDGQQIDHICSVKLTNVLLFALDAVTKDDIWTGHWPHHYSNYEGIAYSLWAKCVDVYTDGFSSDDDNSADDNSEEDDQDIDMDHKEVEIDDNRENTNNNSSSNANDISVEVKLTQQQIEHIKTK
eukprot:408764_1